VPPPLPSLPGGAGWHPEAVLGCIVAVPWLLQVVWAIPNIASTKIVAVAAEHASLKHSAKN